MRIISILLITVILSTISACKTGGCTDFYACNYDSYAGKDDGSCDFRCKSCVQWTGSNGCSSGYYPVSATKCCQLSNPYYCSTTNLCYTTCAAARADCGATTTYKANF
jgi:hypothetical protein